MLGYPVEEQITLDFGGSYYIVTYLLPVWRNFIPPVMES